jgi:3-isopropylmalate/(R)-2-methylmalate dehydratase large subunit
MGMTMIEKILARASGQDRVRPGELVVCDVDRIVSLDLEFTSGDGPMPRSVVDPAKIAVVLDHGAPAPSIQDAQGHQKAREFARKFGIEKLYDIGKQGICHEVILEEGLALPGEVLACADSHTCASGVLNCAARGLGSLEMLQIMCTGKTWYKLGPTVRYELTGTKPRGVYGKDVLLAIAGRYGEHSSLNLEFGGPALSQLSIDDRATIATMAAELSAEFATFPADQVVLDYLKGRADHPFTPVEPDPDAEYLDVREINLSELEPCVSRPDFVPNNTISLREVGEVRIDQAFVGSCSNGKLEDLRVAAEIVKGKQVHPGVRFIVTPASQHVYLQALKAGYVEALTEAGAVVTNSTCGACFGYHMGVLGPGEVCITSSPRNFKGRMGSPDSQVYIGSSATVAASALAGRLADPREYLSE